MDRECLAREFVCSMTYHVLVTCEYSACALLAKGASQAQILSMLRWRSDEALRLYARLNDTSYATWLGDNIQKAKNVTARRAKTGASVLCDRYGRGRPASLIGARRLHSFN